MSARTIEFFWDSVSSYTYLASTQIEQIAERAGVRLVWRPFLLGGVFKATGNVPPGQIPSKGRYLMQDMQRWAQHYGVPLKRPQAFPTNTLLAQRVACAAPDSAALAKALIHRYWGRGEDLAQIDVVRSCITEAGLDADALLQAADTDAVKTLLKRNTDEAVARGAFGAPSFFVGDAMFWGNDRFDLLADYLAGLEAA